MTRDLEAARKTLQKLTMKALSLKDHDIAIDTLIASQAAAAAALQGRISNAERTKAAFVSSPSEAALTSAVAAAPNGTIEGCVCAVAAVAELDALHTLMDAMPPAEHRERQARDGYVAAHKDELIEILTAELEIRLKPRPQWRRTIAAKIAKLSERLALREEGALALAAASAEADQLDNAIANSSAAEGGVRRYINDLANNPSFAALNDVRGSLSTLDF